MLNRSEIFHSAWTAYRAKAAFVGATVFCRARFALCLRRAWADAKTLAFYAALEAEEAAEASADPVKAEARAELAALQMKDRWDASDRARASQLHGALAA